MLIANWNGEAFIERCLGSVLAAVRRLSASALNAAPDETGHSRQEWPTPIEILVTDDASVDRSPELIEGNFPGVRLIRIEKNIGFAAAVNLGMKALTADWVFLLNNDLALQADFCERLAATLAAHPDPARVFAIGAQTRDWETQAPNHAGQRAAWRGGLIVQDPFDADAAAPTDFFQAGACLIDRRKFLALGGFAELYHPGYWEDYDLAWQARRRGWVNLYEPRAVAFHWGKGSMRRALGQFGVSLLLRRNHLLFVWASLTDPGLLARHLCGLPALILRDRAPAGEAGWGRALVSALGRLPQTLALRRRRLSAPAAANDRELLHDQGRLC